MTTLWIIIAATLTWLVMFAVGTWIGYAISELGRRHDR
jgi:hypothetical protein